MTPETKQKVVDALRSGRLYAEDYAHTAAERYGHNSKECERAWDGVATIEAALEALEKEDIDDFLNSAKPLTPEELEEFGRENRKILDRIKREEQPREAQP